MWTQRTRCHVGNFVLDWLNKIPSARRECPCCGWKGRNFRHYLGIGYQVRNIECPQCRSHPRHRGLSFLLPDIVKRLPADARILHLSAEACLSRILTRRPDIRYMIADFRRPSPARDSCGAVQADLTAMPFRASSFSMVLCSHVLEHIQDDAPAIREIARITEAGGQVLIMVPTFKRWDQAPTREFGFADPTWDEHWRIYGSDLKDRVEAAGLKFVAIDFSQFLKPADFSHLGVDIDTLFIATQPD